MRSLPSYLSRFCNEFKKLNYTEARMLDSIYHLTLKLNCIFGVKTSKVCILYAVIWTSLRYVTKSVNHKWLIDFITRCYITPKYDVMCYVKHMADQIFIFSGTI